MDTLPERLIHIIAQLRQALCYLGMVLPLHAPALNRLGGRLGRAALRFAALHAAWLAGCLPQPRRPRLRTPGTSPATPPPARLPRKRGWLWHVGPPQVRSCFHPFEFWLNDAGLAPFLAACPPAARLLRPLCHLFGVLVPPAVIPMLKPPRRRKPRAAKPPRAPKPPRPRTYWPPHTGTGPELPARHRLRVPGINAPRLPQDRCRKRQG